MAKDNYKDIQLIDALTDALGRSEGQSIDEIKKDLELEGVDFNSSMERLMEGVHMASIAAKRSALDQAQAERTKMESKRSDIPGKFASWTKDELIKKIKEMISPQGIPATASYRDLESKSTEDLASLLEDLVSAKELIDSDIEENE